MKLLFVCTGNTCRSPMAQAMAADLFAAAEVCSAGLMAMPGSPASAHAVAAMEARQLALRQHQAQIVTKDLLEAADLVLAMTPGHKVALMRNFPGLGHIHTLGEYAGCGTVVDDPFGGDFDVYQRCAEGIFALLRKIKLD